MQWQAGDQRRSSVGGGYAEATGTRHSLSLTQPLRPPRRDLSPKKQSVIMFKAGIGRHSGGWQGRGEMTGAMLDCLQGRGCGWVDGCLAMLGCVQGAGRCAWMEDGGGRCGGVGPCSSGALHDRAHKVTCKRALVKQTHWVFLGAQPSVTLTWMAS